jgi:hypothetical protein
MTERAAPQGAARRLEGPGRPDVWVFDCASGAFAE